MTVRRIKTYTGQTGYVYQYYFVGNREVSGGTVEYVYDVTSDRKTIFPVSIFVRPEAVADWSATHGRALSATEQYAAAKMRLFQAFDEIEKMIDDGRKLEVSRENIEELLSPLDLT